ncbi:MAG TPA: DUF4160 domain-containing protein [Bacteroidota bacterium]
MPTVLQTGGYRFFFFAGDRDEPPHIHVEHERKTAKFWIKPVRLERSGGFSRKEIRLLQNIIEEHEAALLRSWNEFFNS